MGTIKQQRKEEEFGGITEIRNFLRWEAECAKYHKNKSYKLNSRCFVVLDQRELHTYQLFESKRYITFKINLI